MKILFQIEINMAHQLGVSIKYLKQTLHLNQCTSVTQRAT